MISKLCEIELLFPWNPQLKLSIIRVLDVESIIVLLDNSTLMLGSKPVNTVTGERSARSSQKTCVADTS